MTNDGVNTELLQLAWDELKYRHEHYWKTFFKLGFLVIALVSIPYVKTTDGVLSFQGFVSWFPWVALTLSVMFSWLLYQEHKRIDAISDSYKRLKDEVGISSYQSKQKIGISSVLFFLGSMSAISVVSLFS